MSYESATRIGKYEIRKKLGQGSMGDVYVAYDTVLERQVALKVMAASVMEQSDLKVRFEHEAKAVARLQHPNIVTVYDFGYDDRQAAYIVMELLKGTDLEQSLRSAPPLVAQSLRIVLQACRGLAHAHDHGIVHRDVKPANIFVTEEGLVKIMDFGVARWTQVSQTKTGTVIGTAAFMSPEQLLGHRVDGRSDIFSLGVVFYRLLSHQQPFAGEDVNQIFYRILNTDPPGLLLESEQIPGLQRVLDRALAKDLNDRYRTAHEMARDLAELIPDLGETLTGQTVMSIASPMASVPPRPDTATQVMTGPMFESTSTTARRGGMSRLVRGGTVALAAVAVLIAGLYFIFGTGRDGAEPSSRAGAPIAASSTVLPDARAAPGDVAEVSADPASVGTKLEAELASSDPATERPAVDRTEEGGAPPPSEPPVVTARRPPPPPPVTPAAPELTAAERAASEAEAARAALARGELEEASKAISRGRQHDPSQPVWRDLDDRLGRLRAEQEQRRAAAERAGRYLEEALAHLDADELDQAIAAFRKALVFDPESTQASSGLRQVESLKRQQELRQQSEPRRRFSESPTELVASGQPTGLEGFSAGDTVKVEKGSAELSVPGELLIELNPRDAKPAEPYTLTVRLHNETNTGLLLKNLELVTSYGGRKLGKGVEIPLGLRRIEARSTVLLHEVSGQWKEEQNAGGSITATVSLAKGKLTKVLSWSSQP